MEGPRRPPTELWGRRNACHKNENDRLIIPDRYGVQDLLLQRSSKGDDKYRRAAVVGGGGGLFRHHRLHRADAGSGRRAGDGRRLSGHGAGLHFLSPRGRSSLAPSAGGTSPQTARGSDQNIRPARARGRGSSKLDEETDS